MLSRHHTHPFASAPDGLLLELFQPHAAALGAELAQSGYFASVRTVVPTADDTAAKGRDSASGR